MDSIVCQSEYWSLNLRSACHVDGVDAITLVFPRDNARAPMSEPRREEVAAPARIAHVEAAAVDLPPEHIHDPEAHVAQVGPVLREQVLWNRPGVLHHGIQIDVIQARHTGRGQGR